jgi:hypothetical protein
MILARIGGGLGNQMFQYAAARRLAEQHRTGVYLDTWWFQNTPAGQTKRQYELDQLSITGVVSPRRVYGVREAPLLLKPMVLYRTFRPRYRAARERYFHFDPDVLTLPDKVWMSGFWFSENYFADVAPIIRAEFAFRSDPSPENRACIEQMAGCDSVAVHVRRGDYAVESSWQGLMELGYYRRAAQFIRERCADPTFFVFSDDPEWVRANLSLGGEMCVIDHNRDASGAEDMRLMSMCRHNIVANSSYSWWGAWLNPHPDRIVVGPKRWMANSRFDTRDVLPADWVAM